MPKNELLIDVLGCSIQISAEEDQEYLQNLLKTYKQKIEDIRKNTGLKDPVKIAVLAGFLLCDELEKTRRNAGNANTAVQDEDTGEAELLTMNLISRLGSLLGIEEEKQGGNEIYRLQNTVKYHDWGSMNMIPDLLEIENESKAPWAELWMGVHHEGPSRIISGDLRDNAGQEELPLLSDLISKNPRLYLGRQAKKYSTLPFLFKILAAEKPLSIQAHPNLKQACDGWERENREGIPLNSHYRNYKDINHKPEILCALTPFTAMAGFRHPDEIKNLISRFFEDASRDLKAAVFPLFNSLDEKETPLRKFLGALLSLPGTTRTALSSYAVKKAYNTKNENDEWRLISRFAEFFPGDPAVISPLYLNLINLNPGEAIFLPAGILHAYVYGLGVELMANSDNVLRGGLTNKHIDIPELFKILEFKPFSPAVMKENDTANLYRYPVACDEFSLSVMHGNNLTYPETGPSIILVTRGELKIAGKNSLTILKKGESAFLPANEGAYRFDGDYTLYAAGTGCAPDNAGASIPNS